jgi:hypothetical protein
MWMVKCLSYCNSREQVIFFLNASHLGIVVASEQVNFGTILIDIKWYGSSKLRSQRVTCVLGLHCYSCEISRDAEFKSLFLI